MFLIEFAPRKEKEKHNPRELLQLYLEIAKCAKDLSFFTGFSDLFHAERPMKIGRLDQFSR